MTDKSDECKALAELVATYKRGPGSYDAFHRALANAEAVLATAPAEPILEHSLDHFDMDGERARDVPDWLVVLRDRHPISRDQRELIARLIERLATHPSGEVTALSERLRACAAWNDASLLLGEAADALARLSAPVLEPIPMVLHCPQCSRQHIDAPQPEKEWDNPPHRSHECQFCGLVWRPADLATTGVQATQTQGARDAAPVPARECKHERSKWNITFTHGTCQDCGATLTDVAECEQTPPPAADK